jgi:hypothetical protein
MSPLHVLLQGFLHQQDEVRLGLRLIRDKRAA